MSGSKSIYNQRQLQQSVVLFTILVQNLCAQLSVQLLLVQTLSAIGISKLNSLVCLKCQIKVKIIKQ
jgi:hypothetical protein